MRPRRVLFVCLGNICRSPMAAGIARHLAKERGVADRVTIESCGTGSWHVGNSADARTIATLAEHGIVLDHTARQFDADRDPDQFDLIVPMDRQNKADLLRLGVPEPQLRLMRSFGPAAAPAPDGVHPLDVPDPYLDDLVAFERVYQLLVPACNALLDEVTP
jgi:protein-tyrosine phosphatase